MRITKTERTLSLNVEGNNAYGLYLGGDKNGSQKTIAILSSNLTIVGSFATDRAIQGVNAYGIYNAGNNSLTGNVVFGNGTNAAVGNASTTAAYGIYNAGKLEIAGSVTVSANALKNKGGTCSKAYALYNNGALTFGTKGAIKLQHAINENNQVALISSNLGTSSTLVLGNLTASNVVSTESCAYVFSADAANTILDLKVTDTALNNDNSGYVLNLAGKTAVFNQTDGGKIDLDLGSFDTSGAQTNNTVGTKVIFGSDAGSINTPWWK